METIFQVTKSPYSNVLDLDIWCSLQARVEKELLAKKYEVKALSRCVGNTRKRCHLDKMMTRVLNKLRKVLVLPADAKGKTDLLETKRGKSFARLDLPINKTGDEEVLMFVKK